MYQVRLDSDTVELMERVRGEHSISFVIRSCLVYLGRNEESLKAIIMSEGLREKQEKQRIRSLQAIKVKEIEPNYYWNP